MVNDYLYVRAEKPDTEHKKGTIIQRERSNRYSRRYYVGDGYNENDFKAHFENGILTIVFPDKKTEDQEKPREIKID